MRTSTAAIWFAGALAAAPTSFAQHGSRAPSERTAPTKAEAVSDAELETFATIYADLLDTAEKFEAAMETAQTQEQALAIRERIETESVAKVARRGWTPQKFNSVGDAINRNPDLTDKAAKLIEEKN